MRAMNSPLMISQVPLRIFAFALMASPLVVLFGMSSFIGNRTQVPASQQAQWMSDHMPKMMTLWSLGALLYAVGFWVAFILLLRRILRPRAAILWWWALLCGLLAASYVPLGTMLAVPCLYTLFWQRRLYFNRNETHTA
jgi:hypothetical protein